MKIQNKKIIWLLFALLLTNAAGYLLRTNELDRFVILAGFRFTLGAVLPSVFMLVFCWADELKALLKPGASKFYLPILWMLGAAAITLGGLYAAEMISYNDPDYLYEFGLSALTDLPLYFIWNLPQMLLLFLTLHYAFRERSFSPALAFFFLAILFAYEIVPLKGAKFNYISAVEYLLMAAIAAAAFSFENVYFSALAFFLPVWASILLFGGSSKMLLNIFFARNFDEWEGFFSTVKLYQPYLQSAYLLITLILALVTRLLIRPKGNCKK